MIVMGARGWNPDGRLHPIRLMIVMPRKYFSQAQLNGTDARTCQSMTNHYIFCGRDNAEEFAALLSAIYDLATELIPSYEGG